MGNAAHLVFKVDHIVESHTLIVTNFAPGRLSEIYVAGKFAHNEHIQAVSGQLRTQGAGGGQFRIQYGRSKIGVQTKFFTNAQKTGLGAVVRQIIPFGAAHRAQKHGIGLAAGVDGFRRQRIAGGVNSRAADKGFLPGKSMAELSSHNVQHVQGLDRYFRTDAVAGQNADMLVHKYFAFSS